MARSLSMKWHLTSNKSLMFSVEMLAMLHLYFVACGPTIFYAAMGIRTGIKVIAKVTRSGLIDLLVAVAAPTSLGAQWAAVVV